MKRKQLTRILTIVLAASMCGSLLLTGCGKKNKKTDKDEEVATQSEESEEEKEPVTQTVTITCTGDCTFAGVQNSVYTGSVDAYYDQYGEEYFFDGDGVRDIFENDDMTLINLECVLTEATEAEPTHKYTLKAKPEYIGILTCSSIEACSLANNHALDYKEEGLEEMEGILDDAGIVYANHNKVGYYTTDDGVKIAVVASNLLWLTEEYEDYMKEDIETAKEEGADIIIACPHWGVEKEYYADDYQQEMGHKIIDWGADLVIGNHSHRMQGIEEYKGKLICYSLGNFSFGGNANPSDLRSMLFQQTFTLTDGELEDDIDAQIIPCRISSTTAYNDYQPNVVDGSEKQDIIDSMNEFSEPYGDVTFDDDGKIQVSGQDDEEDQDEEDSSDDSDSSDKSTKSDKTSDSGKTYRMDE